MIEDLLGKLVADKYRIDSLIREDASGDLFAGTHEVLEKPVTVKVLSQALGIDQRWVKTFIDEARSASAISHENILAINDFGTDARGISYAVFEPIDGTSLADLMSDDTPMGATRSVGITKQIADAVVAAQEKGHVHSALSPTNVFVGNDDNVKVYGFGSDRTKVAREADPQYLAPEQCGAFPTADERSDVYSLGVMLFKMLSGTVPYSGSTVAQVLDKQNASPPPPLSAFDPELNSEIEPIVLTAIEADPDRRYQTMEAFAEDLSILSTRLGIPATSAAAAASIPPVKRNVWKTAGIAFAGILVLAAALIYATSVRQTDPTQNMQADAESLPVQPIGPASGFVEDEFRRSVMPSDIELEMLNSNTAALDMVPGGDGYNPWASGGSPPIGAPPQQTLPPMGSTMPPSQTMTIPGSSAPTTTGDGVLYDAENNRCFQNGVLVRCPWLGPEPKSATQPPTVKPVANTNTAEKPAPSETPAPKTFATPPVIQKPASGPPKTKKTPAKAKAGKSEEED